MFQVSILKKESDSIPGQYALVPLILMTGNHSVRIVSRKVTESPSRGHIARSQGTVRCSRHWTSHGPRIFFPLNATLWKPSQRLFTLKSEECSQASQAWERKRERWVWNLEGLTAVSIFDKGHCCRFWAVYSVSARLPSRKARFWPLRHAMSQGFLIPQRPPRGLFDSSKLTQFEDLSTPCFDYSGNFGCVIVHWHRINWSRNVHLIASKIHLYGLDLEISHARWCLKNSFARNIPHDAQLQ